jgi:hypothetical protein
MSATTTPSPLIPESDKYANVYWTVITMVNELLLPGSAAALQICNVADSFLSL